MGAILLVALAALPTCAIRRTSSRSTATITRSGRPPSPTSTRIGEAATSEDESEAEPGPEVEAEPTSTTGGEAVRPAIAPDAEVLEVLEGRASYYADRFHGRSTASGEPYDMHALTAASRDLPFGTVLRVTRVETGASVVVRVNDRGPFGDRSRILDLSRAAAEELDMIRAGVVEVRVEVLERGDGRRVRRGD